MCPVAGESLNRPDESKLSSVRFLLSPLVVLRTPWRPAALSAATGAWLGALVVRICLRVLDRTAKQHENRTTIKAFSQKGEGQIVKKVSLKLLGCMKGPQPLHFYAPRLPQGRSAGRLVQ